MATDIGREATPARMILHLDLDAFFAAVEQRDKPSLRGKPVIVGGTGGRGVVATASYEARVFGARSAMPTSEARRKCPAGTAFLAGRFGAYRASSAVVMELLRELSDLVEQVSIDEAYVHLAAADHDLSAAGLTALGKDLQSRVTEATGGLTAAVGIASSKMMAKIASELDKPGGLSVIEPGSELEVLHPMPVRALAGVGPATGAKLHTLGVETVADLAAADRDVLTSVFGSAHGTGLYALARAQDDRVVVSERAAKSISAEETFASDVVDRRVLDAELNRLVDKVTARLTSSAAFAKTVTLKIRWHDFTTVTRSASLPYATGDPAVLRREADRLMQAVDVTGGLRLLGMGVAGLTDHAQDELALFDTLVGAEAVDPVEPAPSDVISPDLAGRPVGRRWITGLDVHHDEHGDGWVWGSGRGVVTVRFEGPNTAPGRIRTFDTSDPALSLAEPPDWRESRA